MTKRAAAKAAKPDSGGKEWPLGWSEIDWITDPRFSGLEPDAIGDLLVGCYRRDKRGLIQHRYLQGAEEYEGRRALAELLRSHDDAYLYALAELIDPESSGAREVIFGRRKPVAEERRKKGRDQQVVTKYQVIKSVRDHRLHYRCTIEEAVELAAKFFELSDSRVRKLWSDRENILRKYRNL